MWITPQFTLYSFYSFSKIALAKEEEDCMSLETVSVTSRLALGKALGILDLAFLLFPMNILPLIISTGTFKAVILWFDFLIQIGYSNNVGMDFYHRSFFNGKIIIA